MKESTLKLELLFSSIFSKIPRDRSIWLSIDLLIILSNLGIRKSQEIKTSLRIIENLIKGYENTYRTILIPSFTSVFPKTGCFHTLETSPISGALGRYLFKSRRPNRTIDPFYSFYVFGRESHEFLNLIKGDSIGLNSVFTNILEDNFLLLTIGHHYTKSYSIIHHTEYLLGTTYRKIIYFDGQISSPNLTKKGRFAYYGRKLEICDRSGLTSLGCNSLENSKLISSFHYNNSPHTIGYYIADLRKCHDFIIKKNDNNFKLIDYYHNPNRLEAEVITNERGDLIYKDYTTIL